MMRLILRDTDEEALRAAVETLIPLGWRLVRMLSTEEAITIEMRKG